MSDKSKKKGQQVRAEEEPGLGRTQKPASQPPIGRLSSAPAVLETPPMSRSNSLAEPMQKLRLAVFDHLVKKTNTLDPLSIEQGTTGIFIHPAIIKLGLLFRKGVVREDDDRVGALLYAFVSVIEDYTTPSNTQLSRDLDKHVRNQVQYLVDARQHSVGMGNAIKFLRHSITQISPDTSEAQAKSFLVNALSTFANERIVLARTSIVNHCEKVIRNNDVILTFGSSVVVRNVLIELTKKKKSLTLHVIIVDTRPLNDGIETLQALTENNIRCSYTPLAGAAAAMRTVSRVLLGASALLANGTMVAPAGTAMIASLAKLNRIPVIVAAETYKFSERVQLDSIVSNELGNPFELVRTAQGDETIPETTSKYLGSLVTSPDCATIPYQVVNLRYDLTPIQNIAVVATDQGLIPPTSIPVLVHDLEHGGAEKLIEG